MGGVKEAGIRVSNYINAKKRLLGLFGVDEDFFIKPSLEKVWEITETEDFLVLMHGTDPDTMLSSVIVKKDNKHVIARKSNYTLVLALDCVRVCFILDNSKYIGKMPQGLC